MGHVVLLGDSIFDNARYVPDRPPVIEQLRQALPRGWRATLLAVDGDVTEDVTTQLRDLPADATHLVVSAGGNDALGESDVLRQPAATVGAAPGANPRGPRPVSAFLRRDAASACRGRKTSGGLHCL